MDSFPPLWWCYLAVPHSAGCVYQRVSPSNDAASPLTGLGNAEVSSGTSVPTNREQRWVQTVSQTASHLGSVTFNIGSNWSGFDATEGTFYNASALPVYFVHFFPFFYFSGDFLFQLASPPWRLTIASLHDYLAISQTVVFTAVTTYVTVSGY